MKKLTDKDKIEYLYKNYIKTDGLWFVKVEEQFGFDKALEIDREVWKVLPKMQARFLKKKLALGDGIDNLTVALREKMHIDGFETKINIKNKGKSGKDSAGTDNAAAGCDSATVSINRCPWHNIMIKAGREDLSKEIGSVICLAEYTAFAKEFGANIKVSVEKQICSGSSNRCVFHFNIL